MQSASNKAASKSNANASASVDQPLMLDSRDEQNFNASRSHPGPGNITASEQKTELVKQSDKILKEDDEFNSTQKSG